MHQIIKSMNELHEYRSQRVLLPQLCSTPSACRAATASSTSWSHQQCWGAHPSPPSPWFLLWVLPVCGSGAGSPLFAPSPLPGLFLQPTSNRFCPSAAMQALKASRGRCFCDL